MWLALALCAWTATAPSAAPPALPRPLELEVDAVTLYRNAALVHRSAERVASGDYLVTGLPGEVSAEGTRVRFLGGHVVSVELQERVRASVPDERLEALRSALEDARRAVAAARDEAALREGAVQHLTALLERETRAWSRQLAGGDADVEAWRANRAWFAGALTDAYAALRDARAELERREEALAELEGELGRLTAAGVLVQDLRVRVLSDGDVGTLQVDTRLPAAGWEPVYDLRASGDARSVELVHRARVVQSTGEDWTDVRVLLSTARPELGARGPDPDPSWVDLAPEAPSGGLFSYDDSAEVEAAVEAPEEAKSEATVIDEGLSVRYELPQRETIRSRDEPTSVLVGREQLAVEPELYCVPALVETVWLRGRATNGETWTLLPGEASVFFGSDYLGRARIGLVQPGQEFTVHLGAAPRLEVRRTRVEDSSEGPGFFGSKRAEVDAWVIEIDNHGTPFADAKGVATVILQEALPRPADDRIDVVLEEESPKHLTGERWKRDLEDRSIHTWRLRAPRGGTARLEYRLSVRFPKSASLSVDRR